MKYQRSGNCSLTEFFEDGRWMLQLHADHQTILLEEYRPAASAAQGPRHIRMGRLDEELLNAGRDILAETLLTNGEPQYEEIAAILPPVRQDSYVFLSGRVSWSGVLVNEMGQIFPQSHGGMRKPDPFFSPVEVDMVLGEKKPRQMLLDQQYPILFSVHQDQEQVLEFLYFVEAGDPDRDPIVWIRIRTYRVDEPQICRCEYRIASVSRGAGRRIEESLFAEALLDTVLHWVEFTREGAHLQLPEAKLQKVVSGSLIACAVTFSGDHPHYGHKHYGYELHDHFPPNYIWTLEACCLLGQIPWAKRILEHMLCYSVNDEGRFVYRQGDHELFGASAEEYGQLLFLIDRYKDLLDVHGLSAAGKRRLKGMGDILLANIRPCAEAMGKPLVVMCAEADTNERIHAYLNNNLWAVRGLQALSRLLESEGQHREAQTYRQHGVLLLETVRSLLPSVGETMEANLPPFRVGYTSVPLTLSSCHADGLSQEERLAYLSPSDFRSDSGLAQDLTENTYANYRYYLEMLSAMLLPKHAAEAIVTLRETRGGEYLGMSRFYSWVDDWPVVHYARYLLESGRIHKYLLLLYAHTAHHGSPELMSYYEQVTTNGAVKAPDCVPSLLTTAIMTAWMFAYETVEEKQLWLLSAIPASWLERDFAAEGLGFSGGTCSMQHRRTKEAHVFKLTFSQPTSQPVCLFLNSGCPIPDGAQAADLIDHTDGNRIWLKSGLTQAELSLRI